MIPLAMIVLDELRDDVLEVPLTNWNDAIETFFLDRPDESLRVGVAVGRSGRRTNHANAEAHAFDTNPTRPIKSWKEGWESAKLAADVRCRFHDLRHTCCTRMLEGGVPLPVVASLFGWSAATTVRMAKRYGHIGQIAQRQAVALLDRAPHDTESQIVPAPKHSASSLVPTSNGELDADGV